MILILLLVGSEEIWLIAKDSPVACYMRFVTLVLLVGFLVDEGCFCVFIEEIGCVVFSFSFTVGAY